MHEVFEGTSSPLIEVAVAEPAVSSPRDGRGLRIERASRSGSSIGVFRLQFQGKA